MNTQALHPLRKPGAVFDPPLLDNARPTWTALLGPTISLAILAVVLREIGRLSIRSSFAALPLNPVFWSAFLLYFFATPFSEWIIYRRLWSIPTSGIAALLRKHVSDRLLFGYLGEFYFYGWARQHGQLIAAPFGAIKDVAILSAVCGNLVAIALLPVGIQLIRYLLPGHHPWLLVLSLSAFTAMTLLPLLFRRRLFSLPPQELRFVAAVQTIRAIAGIVLYAAMWHLLLPADSYLWWLALAALRQVVTRLPFVPDDEVVFTAFAVFFLGEQSLVAGWLALLGSMSMALLIVLGLALGATGLLAKDSS